MKFIKILTFIFMLLTSSNVFASSPKVYLTYVMHLEPKDESPFMYTSEKTLKETLYKIITWAKMVEESNQSLELLFSPDFLLEVQKLNLPGENPFLALDNLSRVEVGVHVDEDDGIWRYADAMELLTSFGVEDHGIVGGTFYYGSDYTYREFWDGQISKSGWKWTPKIIHGLSSPNHTFDIRDSGVWRPSFDDPWENDPNGNLISIGGHRKTTNIIYEELDSFDSNLLNTSSIQFFQKELMNPDFLEQRKTDIEFWANEKDVSWNTFTEIAEIWKLYYDEESSLKTFGLW